MTEVSAEEHPWLTLTEAAEMTGVAREAIRARARRGLIPSRKGNRDQMLVQVPADLLADRGQGMADGPADHARGTAEGMAGLVADLQAEVLELRVALARSEVERDAARSVAAAELATKDALMADLQGHHRERVSELRASLAASEADRERLQELLSRALDRPSLLERLARALRSPRKADLGSGAVEQRPGPSGA